MSDGEVERLIPSSSGTDVRPLLSDAVGVEDQLAVTEPSMDHGGRREGTSATTDSLEEEWFTEYSPDATRGNDRRNDETTVSSVLHWFAILAALMRKNILLLWSAKIQLLIVLLLPSIGVGITRGIENMVRDQDYVGLYYDTGGDDVIEDYTSGVLPCRWYDVYGKLATTDCVTILFAPASPDDIETTNELMKTISAESELPFSPAPEDTSVGLEYLDDWKKQPAAIFGVKSVEDMGEFLTLHPGRAETLVYFKTSVEPTFENTTTWIDVWYNRTYFHTNPLTDNKDLVPRKIRKALLARRVGKILNISITVRRFQETNDLSSEPRELDDFDVKEVVDATIATFFPIIIAFLLGISAAMLANQAAREKQMGLIGSLRVVGMPDSAYWVSWFVVVFGVVILPSTLFAMAVAYACPLAVVTEAGFLVPWLAVLFTNVLFYSVFLWVVSIATNRPLLYGLQFIFVLVGLVSAALSFVFGTSEASKAGRFFQYVMPGYNLGKIFASIRRYNGRGGYTNKALGNFTMYKISNMFDRFGQCNEDAIDQNMTCINEPLFDEEACYWKYDDCGLGGSDNNPYDSVCAPDKCYYFPISDFNSLILILIQAVVFLIMAWYFFQIIPSGNGLTFCPWFLLNPRYWLPRFETTSDDEEQRRSAAEESILIRSITKQFKNNTAVNAVDMDIQTGQVFVILGHNGAGKTTLINMLTGKTKPTSGNAYFMGLSLVKDIHGVQRLVGSVPQHDLLWSELSATEHIRMFAKIKGIARTRSLQEAVDRILQKVHLTEAADQPAGGYSGGMRRRLSIALAGIGEPKVLFMDEPTTGIDPLNRRRIWNLIRELKRDRIVVLTTHLMQEADFLGDYIAILDEGKVQAQGTPLNLKSEHGAGYTLHLVSSVGNANHVVDAAKERIPSVQVVNDAAGSLALGFSKDDVGGIPDLTRILQEQNLIEGWSVSQSTLEEVFLCLAQQSELMNQRQEQMNQSASQFLLSNGQEEQATDSQEDWVDEASDVEEAVMVDNNSSLFATPGSSCHLELTALLWKFILLKKRHPVALLIQLLIPVGLIAVVLTARSKQPHPSLYQEVWPGAYIDTPQKSSCSFQWKAYAELQPSDRVSLTDPDAATRRIEYPSAAESSDIISLSVNVRTQEVSTDGAHLANDLSAEEQLDESPARSRIAAVQQRKTHMTEERNHNETLIVSALVAGMEFYLSRASNKDDQSKADVACALDGIGAGCGPCTVSNLSWKVVGTSDGSVQYSIESPWTDPIERECTPSTVTCSLMIVNFLLVQPLVLEKASNIFGSQLAIQRPCGYRQFEIPHVSKLVSPASITSVSPSWEDKDYCGGCDSNKGQVYMSGEGASDFSEGLGKILPATNVTVINTDVISFVHENRQKLSDIAIVFGSSPIHGVADCAKIGMSDDDDWWSQDLSNPRGYVANLDSPIVKHDVCNATQEPLSLYYDNFPDGGVVVSKFNSTNSSVNLVVDWVLYGYRAHEQSVYMLACDPDDSDGNGSCVTGASISCIRATPEEGCDGVSSYSPTYVAEVTYKALVESSNASILDESPVLRSLAPNIDVTWHAAVSFDEITVLAIMFSLSIALIVPPTASALVMEKNQRYVYTLVLNGLNMNNYWLSHYIQHFLLCLVIAVICIVTGLCLRLGALVDQAINYGHLVVMIVSYIHAQFGFVVLASTLFTKERFAAVLIGFVVYSLIGGATIIQYLAEGIVNGWPGVLSLIPMFGFLRGLALVFWDRYFEEMWKIVGIMLGSSTFYLAVGVYIHRTTGVGALPSGCYPKRTAQDAAAPANDVEDGADWDAVVATDVAEEERRTMALSPNETAIKVVHLGKTFPARPEPKHAVDDVTYAMDYGEIFGLLGPNGCGKTTTISMLVGQLTPGRGKAYVGGFDAVEERSKALKMLGIVPQFDVYYEDLTVGEHLEMYAAMKGVIKARQREWANFTARKVGLGSDDLFNRRAGALSGGMRRRLSIAVALLSNPKVLFLDEPTTGLDPNMKRAIWTIIEKMREDRCIILTTHAMDEAEVLCNRIGIMAKGTMRCIGTPAELRDRFGSTVELKFTVAPSTDRDNVDNDGGQLETYLKEAYGNKVKAVSRFGQTRVFTAEKEGVDLADLFEKVIMGQNSGLYTEWEINNTSLDEVFIAITAESEGLEAGEL